MILKGGAKMKLYTTQEVANILQISTLTVRRYIKQNKLNAVKIGRDLRITQEQLDEFILKYTKGE